MTSQVIASTTGPQACSPASFGTPRDITLAELAVELFYPADAPTEAALRALADA